MILELIDQYLKGIDGQVVLDDEEPIRAMIGEAVGQAAENTAVRNLMTKAGSDGNPLRASMLGKCPRMGWYMRMGKEVEPLQPRARMVFMFGDLIEAQVVALVRLAGLPIHATQMELKLPDGVSGHVDVVLDTEDGLIPVEIKSMSRRGFDEAEKLGSPANTFGYHDQIQAYMRGLDAPYGIFLCVNKEQGHLAEYLVKRADEAYLNRTIAYLKGVLGKEVPERPYQAEPELFKLQGKAAAEAFAKANPTLKQLESKGSWATFETGRMVLPIQCGYCAYRKVCWPNVLELESDSGKPVWVVGKEGA